MTGVSRILIVNPFASGVNEKKLAAVQAALPSGTETVLTQARGEATELARRVVAPRRGDLRLLGRRHLQRGDQRPQRPTSRWGSFPVAARACCRARSACHATRPGPRSASRTASCGGSPSAGSTAAGSRSTRGSGSTRSSCGASTGWAAAPTASGPGTSHSPGPSCGRSSEHRLRYEPVLEVEGLGRAAFVLVANCSPYTYAGHLGLRVRARCLVRGRPRHRRADLGAGPGDPAARHAGAARTAGSPATCCSATTSTGS